MSETVCLQTGEVPRGMKKYESLLKIIFNIDNILYLSEEDWQGCIGVACVMAVLDGAKPSIFEISRKLQIEITNEHLEMAFDRLRVNGIFSAKYNLRNDMALLGRAEPETWRTASEINISAWCGIAGIASGYAGLKECC